MPYATRADLAARFGAGEIADLAPVGDDGGSRAEAALADAAAEMDAALAAAYELPLPGGRYPLLAAVACDLARARLYDDGAPERVLGRAASARKRLRALAGAGAALVDARGRPAPRRPLARASAPEPALAAERLRGF